MKSESLKTQTEALVQFASNAAMPAAGGFGRLQSDGIVKKELGLETWINCRMAYVFALELLAGNQACKTEAELGQLALSETLNDSLYGGWVEAVGSSSVANSNKAGYAHAFVLLAAATLNAASVPGSDKLLHQVKEVISEKFWSEQEGACLESFSADWAKLEDYRGANSNMHMVEAFLACFDQTGEKIWLDRALRITDRLLNVVARENNWRLVEHFDSNWAPVLDYNSSHKDHPFRPFGGTVGHWFEWARLSIQLKWALESITEDPPSWLTEVAKELFQKALDDGWQTNGQPGFCYTVDWNGEPVVDLRMSWVICEAISAAEVLALELDQAKYQSWSEVFWNYALEYFPDREFGNWHSELDAQNRPSKIVWSDKPDVYHLYQALAFSRRTKAVSLISLFKENK
jgi:mannose/cellobiose epimerase-like protein (N-acyl-D-glucosamine 2-epimerase family)